MKKETTGQFIKKLRTEAGMTQKDLAKLVYVGRQAISKWERGITHPDFDTLAKVCEVFHVEVNEVLSGKRNTNYVDVIKKMYNHENKLTKIIFALIAIIALIFISTAVFYLVTNYNAIKVYTIEGQGNSANIENGILVSTKKQIYFRLGDVTSDNNITKLRLYILNSDGEETTIYECKDCESISLYDNYQYNAYFANTKKIINKLFLEVDYDESREIVKLAMHKDFSNKFYNNNNATNFSSNLQFKGIELSEEYEELSNFIKSKSSDSQPFTCEFKYDDSEYSIKNFNGNLTVNKDSISKHEKLSIIYNTLTYEINNEAVLQCLLNTTNESQKCTNNQNIEKVLQYIKLIKDNC